MDLKVIKVLIGTNTSGGALYPDFNKLPVVKDSGMDWAHYVDSRGTGWHYDKCCAHAVESPGSPVGVQFGMLMVPKGFADDALANFPAMVSNMTEAEVEDFYDNHCHAHETEDMVNQSVIQAISAKQNAGIEMSDTDRKALDADDTTPGIVKNLNKTWATHKVERKISLVT